MELIVKYATNERKYYTPNTFSFVTRTEILTPLIIFRRPCGIGRAKNRYYYSAKFVAPSDYVYQGDEFMVENVNRKLNPTFNPKKLIWDGNKATV